MHCLVIMYQSYVLLIANQCCLRSRQGLLFLFYSFPFYQILICLSFGIFLFHLLTKHRKAVSSLPSLIRKVIASILSVIYISFFFNRKVPFYWEVRQVYLLLDRIICETFKSSSIPGITMCKGKRKTFQIGFCYRK